MPAEREVQLLGKESADVVYVDGMAQLMFGAPMSKLFFATSIDTTPTTDVRKVDLILTLPTVSLLEMCLNVLALAQQQREHLRAFGSAGQSQFDSLLGILDRLTLPPGDPAPPEG